MITNAETRVEPDPEPDSRGGQGAQADDTGTNGDAPYLDGSTVRRGMWMIVLK